jgi:hypothetical protein
MAATLAAAALKYSAGAYAEAGDMQTEVKVEDAVVGAVISRVCSGFQNIGFWASSSSKM